MPVTLTTHKFSDLYDMSSGISTTRAQAGHGAPFCSFSTVFNGYFLPQRLPDQMDTSKQEQVTYSIKKGDVLLTRTSETLDELGMSSIADRDYPGATFSGFLKRLRPKQDDVTYHRFMAFYLRGPLFRKAMNNNAVMTLRCSLNEDIFSYLELLLPDYNTQVAIGDFLHGIHREIEINEAICAELDAIARLTYDHWLLQCDFPTPLQLASELRRPELAGRPYKTSGGPMIYRKELNREVPAGWKVSTVGQTFRTHLGGTPPRSESDYWSPGEIAWLSSAAKEGVFVVSADERISQDGLKNCAAKELPPGTVILSIVRHLRASILGLAAATNQSVVGIEETDAHKACFIYPYLLREIPRLMSLRTGNQQPHINKGTVDSSPLALPDSATLKEYTRFVGPLFSAMRVRSMRSAVLAEMREWLLPLLMNGQVGPSDLGRLQAVLASPTAPTPQPKPRPAR